MQAAAIEVRPQAPRGEPALPLSDPLDALLRRMRSGGDFPALGAAIHAIHAITARETGSNGALADAILRDFALTQKLLRVVNSVTYSGCSGTRTATISRAIVILGHDAVRNIAISLLLLDQIGDRRHAELLRREFLRASLAGLLGRGLSAGLHLGNPEEAYICALFHKLGRLLCSFYLPDEAERVRERLTAPGSDEDAAAATVLGLSYEQLGIGVARRWGLPETLVESQRRIPAGSASSLAVTPLRALSNLASDLGELFDTAAPDARRAALDPLLRRYGGLLGVSRPLAEQVMQEAEAGLAQLASAFGIDGAAGAGAVPAGDRDPLAPPPAAGEPEDAGADAILATGIQDLGAALLDGCALSDVLRIVIETVYRALRPRRVFVCLRDGRSGEMQARFALGERADALRPVFRFAIGHGRDLFNLLLARDQDLLIEDSSAPRVRQHLPAWYRPPVDAPCFLALPLRLREVPVALIYADHGQAHGLQVGPTTLSLLRGLRQQALLAIKTAQG